MRLVTFALEDDSRLGILLDDRVLDLAATDNAPYFSSMASFLDAGDPAFSHAQLLTSAPDTATTHPLTNVRLLAPVPRPGKIIAVGLNYRLHTQESQFELPTSPVIFAKFPNSITGPDAPIVLPADDPQADYEAELAVVIGKRGRNIAEADALSHLAGYMPLNDVSARRWQFDDKQWVRGKSPDTFCPIGPWLTTRDSVPDPHSLRISCRVNGETLQDSNTSYLIFNIPTLIAFLSKSMTLDPGDIIATGTPEGVGFFRDPKILLKSGDVVEVDIEGLGILRNTVVDSQ
jgi:acylpyruvate hydrolase